MSANIVLSGISGELSPDSSHVKINTNENSKRIEMGNTNHLASMSDPSENLKT